MNKDIAIIDGDSIIFSACHPMKELDSNGEPVKRENKYVYKEKFEEDVYKGVDYILTKICKETKAKSYIGFLQGKNNFRYTIYPEYKANRKKRDPLKWYQECKEYMVSLWKFNIFDGAETDDFVNITRLKTKDSFICAIDKDLLALEGIHWNWRTSQWITINHTNAVYNFWLDMISGQNGDNIKGLPKRGEVYAKKLYDNVDESIYSSVALKAYTDHFGQNKGINEFYKNYKCLHILEEYEGFEVPAPIQFNIEKKDFKVDGEVEEFDF